MSAVHTTSEQSCPGCGASFRLRSEIELAWRDKRFCSSSCQRRSGTVERTGQNLHRKPVRLTPVF